VLSLPIALRPSSFLLPHGRVLAQIYKLPMYMTETKHPRECSEYPIGFCNLPLGKPSQQWYSTLKFNDRHTTAKSNFRIGLLVGCDGLETDVSRFHYRSNGMEPYLQMCHSVPGDPSHFILRCPSLASRRHELLSDTPAHVRTLLPDVLEPDRFVDVILGRDGSKASLVPRLYPRTTTTTVKEGESLVPFRT